MNKSELCINLWFCFDKEDGFINAVAGRGYFLSGSDEQKKVVLKVLAISDYLNVVWQPIPERFVKNFVDVDKNKTTSFPGVVHSSDIDVLGLDLFEEVFKLIESINQTYLPVKNTGLVKVPDEPLYVMTPVENLNKKTKAIVG